MKRDRLPWQSLHKRHRARVIRHLLRAAEEQDKEAAWQSDRAKRKYAGVPSLVDGARRIASDARCYARAMRAAVRELDS